ncbi:hypothetical protein K6Y31_13360 [Motilimonas cestriensis]|uniref:Uncharacterized protein n=1 Tax=Motilimonas cestriensis TaxID=2742685 RepID=A0ABS8W9U9_9GAMM|nr:hypothetical protein [Motilimonas cestriensis]MCE2595794.1 hypothetical protein [Motilimonas cestriensis]
MAHPSSTSHSEQSGKHTKVQIELDRAVLARLFAQGHLCAAEISCLNFSSKQAIWQLCLQACGECLETTAYGDNNRPAWEKLPRLNSLAGKSSKTDA